MTPRSRRYYRFSRTFYLNETNFRSAHDRWKVEKNTLVKANFIFSQSQREKKCRKIGFSIKEQCQQCRRECRECERLKKRFVHWKSANSTHFFLLSLSLSFVPSLSRTFLFCTWSNIIVCCSIQPRKLFFSPSPRKNWCSKNHDRHVKMIEMIKKHFLKSFC